MRDPDDHATCAGRNDVTGEVCGEDIHWSEGRYRWLHDGEEAFQPRRFDHEATPIDPESWHGDYDAPRLPKPEWQWHGDGL